LEQFTFHATEPNEKESFDFERSLFHHRDHLSLQKKSGWRWYYARHIKRDHVVMSLFLNIDNGVARSAVRSPYGTIECTENLPAEALYDFLKYVEQHLQLNGVTRVMLKTPPFHYPVGSNGLLQPYLLNLGYRIADAEVGAVRFTTNPFAAGLNKYGQQVLRKSMKQNLQVKFLSPDQVDSVYEFIHSCHQLKEYALSMSLADLKDTIACFPDRYLLTGVFDDEELIAASMAVRVRSDVLFNFYADHAAKYDALSPMTVLIHHLYSYCQTNRIHLLDLGTSAANNQPNFGLLNFKIRIGALLSPKLTFEKILKS